MMFFLFNSLLCYLLLFYLQSPEDLIQQSDVSYCLKSFVPLSTHKCQQVFHSKDISLILIVLHTHSLVTFVYTVSTRSAFSPLYDPPNTVIFAFESVENSLQTSPL